MGDWCLSTGGLVRIRTRAAHVAAAISAVVLVAGFATTPKPASGLDVDADDLVGAAIAADGIAPVIVRLREQADLGELFGVADAAAETLTERVTATTLDVDGLLAGLTAPVDSTVGSAVDGTVGSAVNETLGDTLDGTVDGSLGDTLDGVLHGTLGGALDSTLPDVAGDTVAGTLRGAPESLDDVPGTDGVLGGTVHELLGGRLDPDLVRTLGGTLDETVDELARMARANAVVDELQHIVDGSAGDLESVLAAGADAGTIRDIQEFWIFNGFAATVDEGALHALEEHPAVDSIQLDEEVTLADAPASLADRGNPMSLLAGFGLLSQTQSAQRSLNWGVDHVRAPEVWDEYGVRGEGVVVGIMDSGVDVRHPAIAGSWRGRSGDPSKSWFIATGERYSRPGDGRGHGTHITGAILGEDGETITGVAPGAQWIAAKVFNDYGRTTVSALHRGFEWMLAPGGDPSAAPDIVNSSWGTNAMNDREFWGDVDAWIAAGIVPVFATGNRGPRSGSISSPASYPHVIAVGASDTFDRVTSFSSRGPVTWNDERRIKPDVIAPGYRIRSAWSTSLGGGYRLMTGTSMAAPHVTGVAALLRSADSDATVSEIRRAIEGAARPGEAWNSLPDNAYGHGIVDALAAVKRLTR